jgi:monoterpene epsilon-lactone hydrolase
MTGESATPLDVVISRVQRVYKSWGRTTPVAQMRSDWDALFASQPSVAVVTPVAAGSVSAAWVASPNARAGSAVLYFHGGGFQVGSTKSHRELMACISATAGSRVLGIDYRLAPEDRFPAALQDALEAYRWMLEQDLRAEDIAVAGDSAGAGLALSMMLSLRDSGRPLPAAAVLMSAWTDLTASGASYESRAALDPIHRKPMILAMARNYLGTDIDPRDPSASPLFGDLRGLPPMLIQVGDHETVLSDSTMFADKARASGVQVELEVWEDMIHVFQQFPADLVEAREAIESIGAFLKKHLSSSVTPAQLNSSITRGP